MNRTERLYRIDQMLRARSVVATESFLTELEVSRATFKRDMEYLRERLHAPIVWDRDAGGYRLVVSPPSTGTSPPAAGAAYALPGLWFSAPELHALLSAQHVLAEVEPGILATHLEPLRARLAALLEASGHSPAEMGRRVRLLSMNRRAAQPQFFADVAMATLQRRQLELEVWSRGRDEVRTRTVSPQRLIHYRDNWYLDAWCHWRGALRSFAVDALRRAMVLPDAALDLPDAELDAHYGAAYGIFAGAARATAVLRFSPARARWVQSERWHPEQQTEFLPDGSFRLCVPYSDERELLMDILRHGREVCVEGPASLRARVADETQAMSAMYPQAALSG